ncbi:hypothetical protein EXIGLDRAFT_767523 [Exidia glandulosa HHB12029]|uniref:Uncharacterized protein n=1 Tax=Exidia glandulosa HHB12029 TaxID=1314781 RepID=A0A165IWJ6_EXIGL|nr:hypothetical protein EXIGLDRAFT_767523 [Exidia glandulosa HHB12029]
MSHVLAYVLAALAVLVAAAARIPCMGWFLSDESVPDLEPPAQPPLPAYEGTPAEPDPYLMLAYEVRQVWRLSTELRAALAHIKLLADIILRQVPTPGRSPYV